MILLQESDDSSSAGKGRRELYDAGVERSRSFARTLRRWIEENDLQNQVSAIGEPMAFPMMAITCTKSAAQRIRSMPEVEAVMPDSDDLRMIR